MLPTIDLDYSQYKLESNEKESILDIYGDSTTPKTANEGIDSNQESESSTPKTLPVVKKQSSIVKFKRALMKLDDDNFDISAK